MCTVSTCLLGTDPTGQTKATKFIVEHFIALKSGSCIVGNLYARSITVKYSVSAQYWMAIGTNQHTGLGIAEYVVLFQHTWKHNKIVENITQTVLSILLWFTCY